MNACTIAGLLITASIGLQAAAAEPWPAFRGPEHTGVAPGADPPVEWGEERNVLWKVELEGHGHASPVFWGDRIYVLSAVRTDQTRKSRHGLEPGDDVLLAAHQPTETGPSPPQRRRSWDDREKPSAVHRFQVSAHDLATGRRIWNTVVREGVPHESLHSTASQASASPVTDGRHVWAFFGSRGLYCLDAEGKIVWQVDLGTQNTRNEFGEGSSPVVHGDLVVVNWDHEGDSFLVALDKRTGKERWRVARDEPTSWSTPLVVGDGDRDVVVVSAANRVRGYDLKTGEELWGVAGLGLNVVPTPVADDESVWVMSGWREAHGMAIRYPGARGDLTGTERVRWETDRDLSYVPSPVLVDGRVYFFKRFTGILSCYRLATGEVCYEPQRIEGLDDIYASPVAAAGRIYVVSRDGTGYVLRAGAEFAVLARNRLDDVFNATPAVAGDTLVLRGDRHLYRIGAE